MKPKQTPSGKWQVQVRHPALPKGRRYFTLDTEAAANDFLDRWRLMKQAGLAPPAEMLEPELEVRTLGVAIRAWANSGKAAPTEHVTLGTLMREVGAVRLSALSHEWAEQYIGDLKIKLNLAPNSIRHRIQALSRALDFWLARHPKVKVINVLRLLPKGYSAYTERDRKLAEARGGEARVDRIRDRRLHPGEYEAICRALSGHQRPDRERALALEHGNAMLMLFRLIVFTGLRLKEALTLTRGRVDLERRVIRAQASKLWRGRVDWREVPLRKELHAALTEYLSTRRTLLPAGPLFPMMEGEADYRPVGKRVSANFRTAFDYAGCLDLTEHDLRHEATCQWFELRDGAGNWLFRQEEINRIMGWAPGSTMAQRYASFRAQDLAARLAAAGN